MKNRPLKTGFILFCIHTTLAVFTFNAKNGGGLEFMWMMFFNSPIMITLKMIYKNNDSTSMLYLLSALGSIHWFGAGYLSSLVIEKIFRVKKLTPFFLSLLAIIILYSILLFKFFVFYGENIFR